MFNMSKEDWSAAPKGNEKAGEKIFKTKCAQCHAVDKAAGHKQGMWWYDAWGDFCSLF